MKKILALLVFTNILTGQVQASDDPTAAFARALGSQNWSEANTILSRHSSFATAPLTIQRYAGDQDYITETTTALLAITPHQENDDSLALVKQLLILKTPINDTNKDQETALILAATVGNADTVKLLLASGANKEARDYRRRTALDCAQEPYALANPAKKAAIVTLLQNNG